MIPDRVSNLFLQHFFTLLILGSEPYIQYKRYPKR
jgi:hypothetical protein